MGQWVSWARKAAQTHNEASEWFIGGLSIASNYHTGHRGMTGPVQASFNRLKFTAYFPLRLFAITKNSPS